MTLDSYEQVDVLYLDFRKAFHMVTHESPEWSGLWDLGFNAKICKSLHIGRNNPWHRYYIHESGEQIPKEEVDSKKGLGVTFESTLRFDKHIIKCDNKANGMLGSIKRYHSWTKKCFSPSIRH